MGKVGCDIWEKWVGWAKKTNTSVRYRASPRTWLPRRVRVARVTRFYRWCLRHADAGIASELAQRLARHSRLGVCGRGGWSGHKSREDQHAKLKL